MTAPIKLGQEWGPNKKWVYSTKPVDLGNIEPSIHNNFGFLAIPKLNKADIKRYENFLAILKEKVLIAPRKEKPAMAPFFHGMTPEEVRNYVKKTPNLFAGKDKKGGLSVAIADKGGFSWGSVSKNDRSKTKKMTKIDKAQTAAVRAGAVRRGGRRGGRARRRTQRGGMVVEPTDAGAAVVPGPVHNNSLRTLWAGPGGGGGYWGTPAARNRVGGRTAVVIFRPSQRGGMQIRNADNTVNFKVAMDINIFGNAYMRAGAAATWAATATRPAGDRGRFTGIIPVAPAVAATAAIPAVTPRTPGGMLIDTYRTFYANNPEYPRTDFYEMVVPGPNGAAVPLNNMSGGNTLMNYTGDCNSPAYQQIFGQNPPAAQGDDAAAVAGVGQCPNQLQKYVFHRSADAATVAGLRDMGNALNSPGWGQLWNGTTPRGPLNSGWDGAFGALRRGYRSPPWLGDEEPQQQPPRSCRHPACPRQGGIQLGCVNYAFVDTVPRVAAWNYTTEQDWREMSCWTHHWDKIMGPYLASGGLVNNGAAIRRNPRMFRYIEPGDGEVPLTAAETNLANATNEPLQPCAGGGAWNRARAGPNVAARNKCVGANYFSQNPAGAWGPPPPSYCRHIAGDSNMNTMVREMQIKVNNMDEYFLSKARLTTPDADGGWGGGQQVGAAVGIPNLIRGYVRFLTSEPPLVGGEPTRNVQAPSAVVWRGGPPYVSINLPPDAQAAAGVVAAGGAGFLGAPGQAMHYFAANAGAPAVMPGGFGLQGTAAALHGQPWADAQLAAGNIGAAAPVGAASPDVQPGWHLLPAYLATSMNANVAMRFAGGGAWENIPNYYGILQRIHISAMIPYISYDQTPLTSQYGEREVLFCRNCIWAIPAQPARYIPARTNGPPGYPRNPHDYPVRVIEVFLLPPFNILNMLNYRQSARMQFANLVVPPQRWGDNEGQALNVLIRRWAEDHVRRGLAGAGLVPAGLGVSMNGGGKKRRKQQKKRKKTRKKKSGGRKRKKTRRRKKRS